MGMLIPVWVDSIIRKPPMRGAGLSLGAIFGMSLCVAAGVVVIHLSTKATLNLTDTDLSKSVYVLGLRTFSRSGRNDQLHGLRQNTLVSEWTGKDRIGRNVVEINRGSFDYTLAHGLTDEEAEALIVKMKEIYPFPESEPSESAGRSSAA